jgi:hypothetical protein
LKLILNFGMRTLVNSYLSFVNSSSPPIPLRIT